MTSMTNTAGPAGLLQPLDEILGSLGDEPKWLASLRAEGRKSFESLGLPTTKDEEWRFTSLKTLAGTTYAVPPRVEYPDGFDPGADRFAGLDAWTMVFINGRHVPALSRMDDLPKGLQVCDLRGALDKHGALLEKHFNRQVDMEEDAFSALNTAGFEDLAVIVVDREATPEKPIHILNLTTAADAPTASHARCLIVADDGSEVTVVEEHAALGGKDYFVNALTEIVIGMNAEVHHYFVEREDRSAVNISTLKAHQARDSRLRSHTVLLGAGLSRNNVNPVLDGENCDSLLNGVYVGNGDQHQDNLMRVVHAQPHCESRQFYKGIMTDEAHGVFTGRIVVKKPAQKTDAVQSNQNLLLSPKSRANTKPQLEIYADDVKCTHGATIGQLDEQAVFYLRSRGMSEQAARGMLIYAYVLEALERMELESVRNELARELLGKLPHTEHFKGDLVD